MPDATFRFLSASDLLRLDRLVPRQALPEHISPEIRDPSGIDSDDANDAALCYIFLSHRWEQPGDPDASGKQLKSLQGWLRMVQDLFRRITSDASETHPETKKIEEANCETVMWPLDLKEMTEGMPQAASLLSRIRDRFLKKSRKYPELLFHDILDSIFVWYDCVCLPQKFPQGRTDEEKEEFYAALENLDLLVRECNVLLCLRSTADDYEQRAWCSLECFVNSQMQFESELVLNCDKFLKCDLVDWHLEAEEDGEDAANDAVTTMSTMASGQPKQGTAFERVDIVMRESRETSFDGAQVGWAEIVQKTHKLKAGSMLRVPDLFGENLRIRRSRRALPQDPQLQLALGQVVRELQWSVFCMSCQDAMNSSHRNLEACCTRCPAGVGLQCGLHNMGANKFQEEPREQRRLENIIEEAAAKYCFRSTQMDGGQGPVCPSGHRLLPNIAAGVLSCDSPDCPHNHKIHPGEAHAVCAACDYDVCYICFMKKAELLSFNDNVNPSSSQALDELMKVCGVKFPEIPKDNTNPSQTLCERQVCLDLHQLMASILSKHNQKCTNDGDVSFVGLLALKNFLDPQGRDGFPQKKFRLNAGLLVYLKDIVFAAMQELKRRMSENNSDKSLRMVVKINAPRSFFLDAANARFGFQTNLLNDKSLVIGEMATKYLEENPGAITFLFDRDASPLAQTFCERNNCHALWSPCRHKTEKQLHTYVGTMLKTSATLDPWCSADLPTTLAQFRSVVANDHLYVIGGAPGGFDPSTCAYTECTRHVFSTKLSMLRDIQESSAAVEWSRSPQLNTARCNFAACVLQDGNGAPEAILVMGGFGTTISGVKAPRLSCSEILMLNQGAASWKEGPKMPVGRTAHHIFSHGGCVFVFGGRATDEALDRTCDIFNLKWEKWFQGPELPRSTCGGGSVLIRERYVVLFGGVDRSDILSCGWVLDLEPWAKWTANGGNRPSSEWAPGPELPIEIAAANTCMAPASETGFDSDWILSVAPFELGNVCIGISVPCDSAVDWQQLKWQPLGGAPAATALGAAVTAGGMLFLIGGHHTDFDTFPSNKVFIRHWRRKLKGLSQPVSCTDPGILAENFAFESVHVGLNDSFLMGRLGFPLPEEKLFASEDGTKKLVLLPPLRKRNLHCQRCLVMTRDLDLSRHKNVTLYGLRKHKKESRRIPFCSECLCTTT